VILYHRRTRRVKKAIQRLQIIAILFTGSYNTLYKSHTGVVSPCPGRNRASVIKNGGLQIFQIRLLQIWWSVFLMQQQYDQHTQYFQITANSNIPPILHQEIVLKISKPSRRTQGIVTEH